MSLESNLVAAFTQIGQDIKAARQRLTTLESTGSATLPAGTVVSAAPNASGVWSVTKAQADSLHTAGARIMWLRAKPDGTNAGIPTSALGYATGDLVYPVLAGESLTPATGIIWSDSLNVASTANLDGRFTDKYAGGGNYTWAADTSTYPANARARIQPTTGIELYYDAVASISAPALPTGNFRVTLAITKLTASHNGGIIIRGQTTRVKRVAVGFKVNASDASKMDIRRDDASSGATSTTVLGSVAFTAGMDVAVSVTGTTVAVVAAGQTFTTTLSTTAQAQAQQFALFSEMYSSFEVKNARYEALS